MGSEGNIAKFHSSEEASAKYRPLASSPFNFDLFIYYTLYYTKYVFFLKVIIKIE